jgi:hypothetical protein
MKNINLDNLINLCAGKHGSYSSLRATLPILKAAYVSMALAEITIILGSVESVAGTENPFLSYGVGVLLFSIIIAAVALSPAEPKQWSARTTFIYLLIVVVLFFSPLIQHALQPIFSNSVSSNSVPVTNTLKTFTSYVYAIRSTLGPIGLMLAYFLLVIGLKTYIHLLIKARKEFLKQNNILEKEKSLYNKLKLLILAMLKDDGLPSMGGLKNNYKLLLIDSLDFLNNVVSIRATGKNNRHDLTFSMTTKDSLLAEQMAASNISDEDIHARKIKIEQSLEQIGEIS